MDFVYTDNGEGIYTDPNDTILLLKILLMLCTPNNQRQEQFEIRHATQSPSEEI